MTLYLDGLAVGCGDDPFLPARFSTCLGVAVLCSSTCRCLPFAIEQIDLSAAELVISSSRLVAKGVLTAMDQLHISYVQTPVLYSWDQMHAYMQHSALVRRDPSPPWS